MRPTRPARLRSSHVQDLISEKPGKPRILTYLVKVEEAEAQ